MLLHMLTQLPQLLHHKIAPMKDDVAVNKSTEALYVGHWYVGHTRALQGMQYIS
jgi:hypothetical protein